MIAASDDAHIAARRSQKTPGWQNRQLEGVAF
jgi:hypothetical protein